ncbi:MAG: FAD-dependent oxidoreductase, partial [Eubacteriales bacterium]
MILREYWTDGTIREKMADDTVFAASYDVIVCGLGVAGSSALVTAAKTGLSVLGIEQFGTMGGQGTVGGIYGYYCGTKGGFYREIDRRAEEIHGEGETVETWGHGDIEKTEALAEYAERYGAETIYDTVVTGVYAADGKHICGVRCLDARGTCRSYGAKMVIDCTAEGLVCMTAGCAMTSGRDTVNAYQPYTNVLLSYRGGRIQTANTDGGFVNQYDPFAFSLAVRESAGMPVMMWPKFAGSHRYLGRAPFLGAREGRCIVGEKRMEFRDILAGKQPEHPVFWCYANIDDHAKDSAFGSELYTIWMALLSQWRTNLSFPVPMEALIPLGFDGILAAGRCISMDHDVACALRMKDEMAKSGETAAYMAYLTITGDGNVRTIPYEKLSSMLRETGVIKEGDRDGYFLDLGDGMKKRELMTDLSEIRSALAADESGECPHP